MQKESLKIILVGMIFLVFPFFVSAEVLGQTVNFNIDSSYDLEKRSEASATLMIVTEQLYFYIDDNWWDSLASKEKNALNNSFLILADEFKNKIYPILTFYFGSEWNPGIDNDPRITILIHPMVKEAGGYFNPADGYPQAYAPISNEREMVYLNAIHIENSNAKSYLAHEFIHLITFNQKNKMHGVSEETWLNELRAEYVPTLLGYDNEYQDSNLQKRMKAFLERPSVSLTEWRNNPENYGAVNLFGQYLVDYYGIEILSNSLFSNKVGIDSLNEALKKRGFKETFSQIFNDWAIVLLINNCSFGEKYCYKNLNLQDLRIVPQFNLLPVTGESSLSFTNAGHDWSAHWYKVIGGKGDLLLEFNGQQEGNFSLIYLLYDFANKYQIKNLSLDENQKGKIIIEDFNENYQSLIIVPVIQTKTSGFNELQSTYLFNWKASSLQKTEEKKEAELISLLQSKIKDLEEKIKQHQASIDAILAESGGLIPCQRFDNNLYFGMMNSADVRCLQEFLKNQGSIIYPSGLVTGNFLALTQQAVVRFQEQYKEDILSPLGLFSGTGYFGPATRDKINQLIELPPTGNNELIAELQTKIKELEKEIKQHQANIDAISPESGELFSCQRFDNNLYFGMMNNAEVVCLQEFLKSHGSLIYPEGLVTGNFLALTQQAVIRFQEKYAQEILYPLNLQRGTGYVGPSTREKINQLIK